MGLDCYVEFRYADLDLRPAGELEAYRAMEQSRVLELLSLGFLTDSEASLALTGNLPPAGFKPLSGTMFKSQKVDVSAQPGTAASQTSTMKGGAPEKTPEQPKADSDSAVQNIASASLAAVQDLAYTMSRQASKPVEVNVAPSELHLTLAQEPNKPSRSFRVVRGEDGKVTGMEVVNGD
jgi:hypothetical protein